VHVTSSPELAQKCEAAGVDAIVAEGFEAGGHNGRDEITTMVLIPQVVDAVKIPVIAAGEPDSGDPETECFPPALRGKALLAADLREIKLPTGQLIGDGREGGRLKLLAGLLGVGLDQLCRFLVLFFCWCCGGPMVHHL
jgi:hypothetical protein